MIRVEFGMMGEWRDRVVARSEREAITIAGTMASSWSRHELGKAPFSRAFWYGRQLTSPRTSWTDGVRFITIVTEEE